MKDLAVRAIRFFAITQNDRINADCFAALAKTVKGVVILNEVKDLAVRAIRFFASAQNDRINQIASLRSQRRSRVLSS